MSKNNTIQPASKEDNQFTDQELSEIRLLVREKVFYLKTKPKEALHVGIVTKVDRLIGDN